MARLTRIEKYLSVFGFSVLGPWFIISQYLKVLVGLHSPSITLLLIPPSIYGIYFLTVYSLKLKKFELTALIFLLLLPAAACVSLILVPVDGIAPLTDLGKLLIIATASYFIGKTLCRDVVLHPIVVIQIVTAVFLFGYMIFISGTVWGPLITLNQYLMAHPGEVSYQGIGRSLVIIFLGVFLLTKTKLIKSLFSGLLFVLTVLVGSRAASVYAILAVFRHNFRISGAMIALFLLLPVYLFATLDLTFVRIAEVRDITQSNSFLVRYQALEHSLDFIARHPIFGYFGYYTNEGIARAHDMSFVYVNFGVVPFITYLFLLSLIGLSAFGVAAKSINLDIRIFGIFVIVFYTAIQSVLDPAYLFLFVGLQRGHRAT